MLYIDFIDTETGKQVFEEGKIIEAQNGIIETIQLAIQLQADELCKVDKLFENTALRKNKQHAYP